MKELRDHIWVHAEEFSYIRFGQSRSVIAKKATVLKEEGLLSESIQGQSNTSSARTEEAGRGTDPLPGESTHLNLIYSFDSGRRTLFPAILKL